MCGIAAIFNYETADPVNTMGKWAICWSICGAAARMVLGSGMTGRHHLIADVPVGVFLSSGLDSTTITGLASESGIQLSTVTLG
jgi:hypothetical protein